MDGGGGGNRHLLSSYLMQMLYVLHLREVCICFRAGKCVCVLFCKCDVSAQMFYCSGLSVRF